MGKHSADAERFAAACAGANTDLVALRRLIALVEARSGESLRLLAVRNALPDHPLHITLGGDTSASETPNAR